MKPFPLLVCLLILLMLFLAAAVSAATDTITVTTTAATGSSTPENYGGSVLFTTDPPGATVWVDGIEVGMSDTTYFSRKIGTLDVLIRKRGFLDYSGTVTVEEGRRVVFDALLVPVPQAKFDEETTVPPVATATTIKKSTLTVPTPWPTTPQSPADPALVTGAAAAATVLFVIRRR